MGSPNEISLLRCNCHIRSPGSLCVLAMFAQYSMNPYVYLMGFGRFRFGCRRRTGFGTTYVILAVQYEANTGPVEVTSMGAVWTTHDSLRAPNRRKPIAESSTCVCMYINNNNNNNNNNIYIYIVNKEVEVGSTNVILL